MSFIGANTLMAVTVLIYGGIPLGVIGFWLLLDSMSKHYAGTSAILIQKEHMSYVPGIDEEDDELRSDVRFKNYQRRRRVDKIKGFLRHPLDPIMEKPVRSLAVSVPVSILVMVFILSGGIASFTGFVTDPVWTTVWLVVVPGLMVVTPLSIFYEAKRIRQNNLITRFPDKLNAVSNANKMGISLSQSMHQVSRRQSGVIEEEFAKVHNDITWNHNATEALIECANRLRIPQISRSLNLIAMASRSTGDLNRILEIAATDSMNEHRLRVDRIREMSGYVAVIVVSFLVYLGVILLLDSFYLVPMAETLVERGTDPSAAGAGFMVNTTPIDQYRMMFFHSALILAFGNGVLAGKMGENDTLSGLKYGIVFTVITVIAFVVVVG